MKLLEIPFYKNDENGVQCLQVCMKSILKYLLDKDFSLEELDSLTYRKENYWTWTHQILKPLHELGLHVTYYSKGDLQDVLRGEEFIKEEFKEHAQTILQHTDIEAVVRSAKEALKLNLCQKQETTLKQLEEYLLQKYAVFVLVDANVLYQRNNTNFQGHFIMLTGFDEENIYYHESGPNNPKPNSKVSKEIFEQAFSALGTDRDCVVVK